MKIFAIFLFMLFHVFSSNVALATDESENNELRDLVDSLETKQKKNQYLDSSSFIFVDGREKKKKEDVKEGVRIEVDSDEIKREKKIDELIKKAEKKQFSLKSDIQALQKKITSRAEDSANLDILIESTVTIANEKLNVSDVTLMIDQVAMPKLFLKEAQDKPFSLLKGPVPLGAYKITVEAVLTKNGLERTLKNSSEAVLVSKQLEINLDKPLISKIVNLKFTGEKITNVDLKMDTIDGVQKGAK